MSVKLKLGEIDELTESMNKLLVQDLPIKISYEFGKLAKRLSEEQQIFCENKIKLYNKYSTVDSENVKSIKPENQEKFLNEYNELFNMEVDIPFSPISISNLGDIKITPIDIIALYKFITE